MYLIEILHQTTTLPVFGRSSKCCILSKFYIKPQHRQARHARGSVVSYRNSTSNHNCRAARASIVLVVSYRNSTSNHNSCLCISEETAVVSYRNSTSNHNTNFSRAKGGLVVSYRNSTSNHNLKGKLNVEAQLYLIEILHQTTTQVRAYFQAYRLYLIEILHQTTTGATITASRDGCILSKFYIKPQL